MSQGSWGLLFLRLQFAPPVPNPDILALAIRWELGWACVQLLALLLDPHAAPAAHICSLVVS